MKINDSATLKEIPKRKSREFQFASKEGLIIVSIILFSIYALWYQIFYYRHGDDFFTWIFIFSAYSMVVFFTMLILLFTGIIVLWKDRRYIITHEKLGGPIFLIGALILIILPIGWSAGFIADSGIYSSNTSLFIGLGIAFCIIGALILAWTGGFFAVWLLGVAIYLIMSFHEAFKIIYWTNTFGAYDNFVGAVGTYIIITSFLLFLYHDIKFVFLSKIVKKGNKLRKEKNFSSALKCFNQTLKIYPLFTTAWNNMGNVYFNQGKSKKAIECYKKALKINPDYINARKNLDVVFKKTRKI